MCERHHLVAMCAFAVYVTIILRQHAIDDGSYPNALNKMKKLKEREREWPDGRKLNWVDTHLISSLLHRQRGTDWPPVLLLGLIWRHRIARLATHGKDKVINFFLINRSSPSSVHVNLFNWFSTVVVARVWWAWSWANEKAVGIQLGGGGGWRHIELS